MLIKTPKPRLDKSTIDDIKKKFLSYSVEKCGVVIQKGKNQKLVILGNIHNNKYARYTADKQAFYDAIKDTNLFDKNSKKKIVCFVHNHLHGSSEPSDYDLIKAHWNIPYLIVSDVGMKWFCIRLFKGEIK